MQAMALPHVIWYRKERYNIERNKIIQKRKTVEICFNQMCYVVR